MSVVSRYMCCNPGGGGGGEGGGTRVIYWWGVGTPKKRGLMCGHSPKREGTRNWNCSKWGGGLGSLFIYYLTFLLVNMINWQTEQGGGGGLRCGHTQKKGGLRCRPNSKKRGALGAGQVKKGGLYRGTYLYWTYMWVSPLPQGCNECQFVDEIVKRFYQIEQVIFSPDFRIAYISR